MNSSPSPEYNTAQIGNGSANDNGISRWAIAFPIGVILISHYFVDVYSSIILPLIGKVETEFALRPELSAILLGLGSISSGLAQPVFAWVSDRFNTRWCGAIGITLAAVGITLIGFAPSVPALFCLFSIGMIGVGMFHPIAASTIGRLAGDHRNLAISWFFVFGMAGFFTGTLAGPKIATGGGALTSLIYLAVPGLVMACVLQFAIGRVEHKRVKTRTESASMSEYCWWSIGCLFVASSFRFLVNSSILFLIVRWMEQQVGATNTGFDAAMIADTAAPLAGTAQAIMFVGQGVGGLAAGALIRTGSEKLPLIWTPILFAPALVVIGFLEPGLTAYVACFIAGVSFAAMTPVAIAVGQRLMPFHTSLASGLMLGAAWAVASVGPRIAQGIINSFGLTAAFVACGFGLALAGLMAMGLKPDSMTWTDSQATP